MTELQTIQEFKEEDEDYDMLLRQAKLLFPEKDEWSLEMAVRAYLNIQKLGDKYQPKTREECEEIKSKYFKGLEYKTEFD